MCKDTSLDLILSRAQIKFHLDHLPLEVAMVPVIKDFHHILEDHLNTIQNGKSKAFSLLVKFQDFLLIF